MAESNRAKLVWTVGTLIALGLLGLTLRHLARGEGVTVGDEVWLLRYEFTLDIQNPDARVQVAPPRSSPRASVFSRNLSHFGLKQLRSKEDGLLRYSGTALEMAQLDAQFKLYLPHTLHLQRPVDKPIKLTSDQKRSYLHVPDALAKPDGILQTQLAGLRRSVKAGGSLTEAIFTLCRRASTPGPTQTLDDQTQKSPSPDTEAPDTNSAPPSADVAIANSLQPHERMLWLCRLAKRPARRAVGFVLDDRSDDLPVRHWVEVLLDGRWVPFDPVGNHRRVLPSKQVALMASADAPVGVLNGSVMSSQFRASRVESPRGMLANAKPSLKEAFDLTRLGIHTQSTLMAVLLLPFGALITTVARGFVGLRTFGVFSATLLALSLTQVDVVTATTFFGIVLLIGMLGRRLLPITIGRVPRLSIVFTIVAGTMAFTISLMEYAGISHGGDVALLPTVVLTSLVDRGYKVADDEGAHVAFVRLCWTLVVSLCCLPILKWEQFGALLVAYPEAHFFTLAVIILIGAYKGKTLADRGAFRFLREPAGRAGAKRTREIDDG